MPQSYHSGDRLRATLVLCFGDALIDCIDGLHTLNASVVSVQTINRKTLYCHELVGNMIIKKVLCESYIRSWGQLIFTINFHKTNKNL